MDYAVILDQAKKMRETVAINYAQADTGSVLFNITRSIRD